MEEQIIVMGGSGGLGREVCRLSWDTTNWSLDTGVDFTSAESVCRATRGIGPVKGIINCCGVNALRPFDDVDISNFSAVMETNAYALVRVVQWLRAQDKLRASAAICNVVSNAARIPMTHSLIYNASKAAQKMITRQMARELKEYTIFSVEPNKLSGTPMSLEIEREVLRLRGWTPEEAQKYQLAALPAGVETPPASLARFIMELMNPAHHPFITGCNFEYGGP